MLIMSSLYLTITAVKAKAENSNPIIEFNHLAEGILLPTAILFKIVIESIALLILALAIIKAVQKLILHNGRKNREEKLNQFILDLGTA